MNIEIRDRDTGINIAIAILVRATNIDGTNNYCDIFKIKKMV